MTLKEVQLFIAWLSHDAKKIKKDNMQYYLANISNELKSLTK